MTLRPRTILFTVVGLVTLLGSIASCHRDSTTIPLPDSTSLTVAVLPTTDCLPFYLADSLGLFDSLGIDVRLLTFQATMDADTAFQRGWADGCVTDLVKATTWRSTGDSIRAILCADVNLSLVTAHSARIREVKSLKEKVLGVTRNSVVDYSVDQILSSHGMIPKDLNRPQINNLYLRQRMVEQNQYDGALLPEPYASLCVAHGAKRILSSADIPLSNPIMALVFRDSMLRARRDDLQKIVKAYHLAVDYINTHRTNRSADFLHFLPLSETPPDSLYSIPPFRSNPLPSDSLLLQVRRWCQDRSLLGRDTANVLQILR